MLYSGDGDKFQKFEKEKFTENRMNEWHRSGFTASPLGLLKPVLRRL